MRGSRFSEEQIIRVLQEAQAGVKPREVCRRHGVSPGTLYRWKAKYGGMQVSDVRRMRRLEEENKKLKQHQEQAHQQSPPQPDRHQRRPSVTMPSPPESEASIAGLRSGRQPPQG